MAEQAVYARLSAIPALGTRVYPLVLPQDVTYPAAVYRRITTTRYSASGEDLPDVEALIQVDLYSRRASGYGAHLTLSDSVRTSMQRVSTPTGTPPVDDVFVDGEREDYEDETDLLRKTFDFRAWYRE